MGCVGDGTGQDSPGGALACGFCGVIREGGHKPRRILVVDDDRDCLDEMVETLKRLGHMTCSFASPNEAIDCLGADTFDVLISDVHMQDMGGPQLALWVSVNRPGMRIVLMSSAAIDGSVLHDEWKLLPKPAPLPRIRCAIECPRPDTAPSGEAS